MTLRKACSADTETSSLRVGIKLRTSSTSGKRANHFRAARLPYYGPGQALQSLYTMVAPIMQHRHVPGWGGGGTIIFSAFIGSGPVSTVHPKKNQEFQAPKKIFEI